MSSVGAHAATHDMDIVAERYAHLVLALGQHDPDLVNKFDGPAKWKTQAEKEKKSLDAIGVEAAELSATLNQDRPSPQSSPKGRGGREALASQTSNAETSGDEMLKLRREYLQKQISALAARVRMLKGEKLKFDDESRALYNAVAPTYRQSGSDPDSHFDQIISQLEAKIPGKGPLWQRYEELAETVRDSKRKTRRRCFNSRSRNVAPGRWRTLRCRLTKVSPSSP